MYKAKIISTSCHNNRNQKPTVYLECEFTTSEGVTTRAMIHESLVGGAKPITLENLRSIGYAPAADTKEAKAAALKALAGTEVTLVPVTEPTENGDKLRVAYPSIDGDLL